jgi:hypothetical protein
MEVHAHSHTARKKWTHYLWEFLMLFLAVFCGFLAENKREHLVEHQREKQYIRSIINDIESDFRRVTGIFPSNVNMIQGLDSLMKALDTVITPTISQLKVDYSLFYTWGLSPNKVEFSDRTITQLKSAGGMRLIRSQLVSDHISTYYDIVSVCNEQAGTITTDINTLIELSYKIYDNLYTQKGHEDMRLALKLYMQNPLLVREFINRVEDLKQVISNYNSLITQIKDYGSILVKEAKEEYHLK